MNLTDRIRCYERCAMRSAPSDDLGKMISYENWEKYYEYVCIRDAVRYPGRIAEPSVKQYLDDNREEYEQLKVRMYERMEDHIMEIFAAGYVRGILTGGKE